MDEQSCEHILRQCINWHPSILRMRTIKNQSLDHIYISVCIYVYMHIYVCLYTFEIQCKCVILEKDKMATTVSCHVLCNTFEIHVQISSFECILCTCVSHVTKADTQSMTKRIWFLSISQFYNFLWQKFVQFYKNWAIC